MHYALRIPFPPSACSSLPQLFRNIGKFGAYLKGYWTDKTIKSFVAMKGNFSGLIFFWTSRSEGEFPETTWLMYPTFYLQTIKIDIE